MSSFLDSRPYEAPCVTNQFPLKVCGISQDIKGIERSSMQPNYV